MQGLFKLGIVGSKEQMETFIKKSQTNETLKDWLISEDELETDGGLRSVSGSGLKKFLDKYKLVIENDGSGNINGMAELADEVSKISQELEVMLLTQYLDAGTIYDWFVYYCPQGETKDVGNLAMISKGEEGMTWWDIKDLPGDVLVSYVPIDEVWEYYKKHESEYEDKITMEVLKYFVEEKADIADGKAPKNYDDECDLCDYLLNEFFYEKAENIKYSYLMGNEFLPPLDYVSKLFEVDFCQNMENYVTN